MKKHSVLTVKLLTGFVFLAILICGAGTTIGYMQYKQYIQRQYNDTAYQVAEVFLDYMTEQELFWYVDLAKGYKEGTVSKETLESVKSSLRYRTTQEQLAGLRENMGVNDIYLAYLDAEALYGFDGNTEGWGPMVYVFDAYIDPELVFDFGDMGGLNPKYVEDAIRVAETGQRSDNYFISESVYGYNTSSILPVVKDGRTVAVVGVEVPMSTLESALSSYAVRSVFVMALVTALCMAGYAHYLYRHMISPINLIAQEVDLFIKEENQISDQLSQVRTGDEIEILSRTILKMEEDINSYILNLTQVTAEKERIGAELHVATQIQADMLPRIFPPFPERKEFDIFASMCPAKEVGGDFYDFFLVDSDHLAMVVGDVSGKGVPAALFMVIAKTLIKNHAQMGKSPKEIMETVNNQLCENNEANMFVTAWLGILTISTGLVKAVSAGHEYPILRQNGQPFDSFKDRHGMVLGAFMDMRHVEYEIQLRSGDCLFVYTDGATDATNEKGEQFGVARLRDSLNQKAEASPMELLPLVKEDIDRFVGKADQFDDITMLCMQYRS